MHEAGRGWPSRTDHYPARFREFSVLFAVANWHVGAFEPGRHGGSGQSKLTAPAASATAMRPSDRNREITAGTPSADS